MKLELVVVLVKPHLLKWPQALHELRERILRAGFYIVRSKRCLLSPNQAVALYRSGPHLHHRAFVNQLTSGPLESYLVSREAGLDVAAQLLGPNRVFHALFSAKDSLRADYGLSDAQNAVHSSKDIRQMSREAELLFPEFNIRDWYEREEAYFSQGYVTFDPAEFRHVVNETAACRTLSAPLLNFTPLYQ